MSDDKRQRLRHELEQARVEEQQHSHDQKSTVREFSSVEELLRYDAAQTMAPIGLERRLNESAARLPRETKGRWRRLFRRG